MPPWYASPYTGLFRRCGPVPPRAHDPAVAAWAGTLPRWALDGGDLAVGGAGWDAASAELAGVGEAVERWQCRPLPQDGVVEASFADWTLDEPAVEPRRWVLFHGEQYATDGFPFVPFTPESRCHWVRCRDAATGGPWWVPEWQVFLQPRGPAFGPSLSTGLSCGRSGDPVLLRGLQEVIERDALVGAWWGRYPLAEHDPDGVLAGLGAEKAHRLRRPNLRYRCYRIDTPYSAHVAVTTLVGEDHEGPCFSTGSACRETRRAAWEKALLEAVQGRYYVRHLKSAGRTASERPADFAEHALYYSEHPDRLAATPLGRARGTENGAEEAAVEGRETLAERLRRPVLFRLLSPPGLSAAGLGWVVLRVLVPDLQPLHGHHDYPFLGGPLWAPRGVADWREVLPHPFA